MLHNSANLSEISSSKNSFDFALSMTTAFSFCEVLSYASANSRIQYLFAFSPFDIFSSHFPPHITFDNLHHYFCSVITSISPFFCFPHLHISLFRIKFIPIKRISLNFDISQAVPVSVRIPIPLGNRIVTIIRRNDFMFL